MRKYISFIHDNGGVLFPPASPKAIRFVNQILGSHGFTGIPKEYEEFLQLSDGVIWSGIELSGTRSEERKERNYNFPGLIEINLDFMTIEALRGKLVFGRAAEELFAYDTVKKTYIVLERLDLTPHTEFLNFPAFLEQWIN